MSEARKLAAILVADIVGYSRLAAADEGRALAHLRGLRSDLMDPATAAHHGRSEERVVSRENASLSSRLRRFPQLRCSPGRDPKWLLNLDWRTFDRSLRTSARGGKRAVRGHKGKARSPPESGRRRPPEESQIGAFTTSRAWFAAFGSRREPR